LEGGPESRLNGAKKEEKAETRRGLQTCGGQGQGLTPRGKDGREKGKNTNALCKNNKEEFTETQEKKQRSAEEKPPAE